MMGSPKANGYVALPMGHLGAAAAGYGLGPCPAVIQQLLLLIKSALPFLAFLLAYFTNKALHVLPLMEDLGCVHIYTLGAIERLFLGGNPHSLVSAHHSPCLDVLSAVPYMVHYTIPLVFPLYLLLRGQTDEAVHFLWLLGWVMWINYLIWLVFPNSPPWVMDTFRRYNVSAASSSTAPLSVSALLQQHSQGCAFARLDRLTGGRFFANMFAGNPVPYASFPSGHVAWPLVVYMCGAAPGGNLFLGYVLWITWATLYSCHHYLLDALGSVVVVMGTRRAMTFLNDRKLCLPTSGCRPTGVVCTLQF